MVRGRLTHRRRFAAVPAPVGHFLEGAMSRDIPKGRSGNYVGHPRRYNPTCGRLAPTDSRWPTGVTREAACAAIAERRALWEAGVIVVPPEPAEK